LPTKISLCCITGNEEPAVERFLTSFAEAFDELCLVRAIGCQPHDKTLSVAKDWCRKHGKGFVAGEYKNAASVPQIAPAAPAFPQPNEPWTWPHVDDFAAARNMAWSLATCPWQFWADLDDLLVPPQDGPGGAELLRLCAEANTHDQFFFTYDLRGQQESNVRERLFRTGISIWVQPVHEQCRLIKEVRDDGSPNKGLIEPRVIFEHAPQGEKKRDPKRNERIMEYAVRYIHAYAFELHREAFYRWQMGRDAKDAEQATKWAELAHETDCLPEQRYDLLVNQAQIAAVKDVEHSIDLIWSAIRINPKNRVAWGDLAGYELRAGRGGRAAMATGFMQAIPKAASSGYPQSEKYHGWEGLNLRILSLRAGGKEDQARKTEEEMFAKHGRRISLIHATRGRPEAAIACRAMWFRSALVPLGVEHIFAIDADDARSLEMLKYYRHVVVKNPNGCVRAWNAAAAVSKGAVLVQLSDDWVPCHDWDDAIWTAFADVAAGKTGDVATTPLVLAVKDNHREDALLCMAILTRARYEQQGREMFSGDYFGVFSDNEFTVRAYSDGVVVPAPHIVFSHEHPIWKAIPPEKWDETHRRQNAPERYAEGMVIFNRRNPQHAYAVQAAP
jgi:hypothetical protein